MVYVYSNINIKHKLGERGKDGGDRKRRTDIVLEMFIYYW